MTRASTHASQFDFVVPEALAGERLDRAMARVAPGVSRGEARRLIAAGVVFVGGRRTGISSRQVRAGEHLQWDEPAVVPPEGEGPQPRIVLERPELLIIDKPAGMPVEPTRGGTQGTLVDWLRRHHGGGLVAHRLDVATSGLLVVAREREALVALNALFAAHAVRRLYLAVVSPAPAWERATLDEPLDGRRAVTHASVLGRAATAALVRVELETGRTQQIRRHLRLAGHPVVGESAGGARDAGRLLLHAFFLGVPWADAANAPLLLASAAPPPPDFAARCATLGLVVPDLTEALAVAAAGPGVR